MALNTLTLPVVDNLVQGYRYHAPVGGLTASSVVDVDTTDAAPGWSYVNGILRNRSLPYEGENVVAIRERNPLTGETKTTRIAVTAVSYYQARQNALTLTPNMVGFQIVPVTTDGAVSYVVRTVDATGAAVTDPVKGGGMVTLPYDPVLIVMGDSNARGSATAPDQAAYVAAYVPDPKVQVLNASNVFVQYVPGTLAGMNGLANTGNVGAEIGFIRRFRAAWPNNTLYIIKLASVGSTQTRGPGSTGTPQAITASITAGKITPTSPAALLAANGLILGEGLPTGLITGGAETGVTSYCYTIGSTTLPSGLNVASQAMTYYPASVTTGAWSPAEGTLWSGLASSITNGYRNKSVVGLGTLATKKIVAVMHMLGTNDKASPLGAAVWTRYQADAQALIASMKANWSLPASQPIILARVRGSDTGSLAVRSYQQDIVTADPQCQLMDMDGYSTHDGTHFPISQLDLIGDAVFGRAAFV